MLFAIAEVCAACRSKVDPQIVYRQIEGNIQRGDLPTALTQVNKAIDQYGSQSQEWNWRFRILKAQILVSQSSPKEALTLLQGDLPSVLASSDIGVSKAMFQGVAYTYDQKFDKAEKEIAEAERLADSTQPQLLSEVLNAKGALEAAQKKYAQASATLQRALSVSRQQKKISQEVRALGNLAWVSTNQEHLDEAIDQNQEALKLARSLGMQSLVGTILSNLGWAYFQLGDFENSLLYFQQGEESSKKSGLTGYGAYWLTGIANSYRAAGDDHSAELNLQNALNVGKTLDDKQTITESLNGLAEISLETGRTDLAEKYVHEALDLEKAGLDHFGTLQSVLLSGRVQLSRRKFKEAEASFLEVLRDPSASTPYRWEAQSRLAKLYDQQDVPQKAEAEYRESIDTIEAARSAIDRDDLRVSFLSGAIEFYDDYVDFLVRRGRPDEALRIAELSRAQTLEEGLAGGKQAATLMNPKVRPQKLAQRLRATLLFYWLGREHSYLWVITPEKTASLNLPPAPEINAIVKTYREVLLGVRDPLEMSSADGQKLYEILVEPANKLIPLASRVILLPDGSLYGLNFETLIVPGSKPHYWIDDVTLTTANSLTLLASGTRRRASKETSMFLVGDTVAPNTDFPALPQAAAEMQHIERYFPAARREVLSGTEATPAAYLSSKPEKYSYLHFVTHGTASRSHPLESAVILSREKNEDSYKLYARDIIKLRLSADLVTISACNGAGTRAFSGEGLIGLSWAFLRAGAHNVIGALWEVSDSSTPQLMDTLYEGLSRGQDPASALRAAKLSLLHSDSVFKKPRYWAPFQLYAGS